ncbi:MAG: hypothetical protein GTO30_08095, partial [Acidobacteria bacterium]|nr:hypothetical protein [Acidobacteriota bacterium]NIO58158.1 hypothetical protein [Acidobacteriota bacterium]
DVPLWKQWPHEAVEDGRSVLRVDGRRYETRLVRVEDPSLRERVGALVAEKYAAGGDGLGDDVWIFRLDPRASS